MLLSLVSPIVFPRFVYEEQNVPRMKSAEIWNYLVLYTRVYVACSRETRISRVSSFPINPYVVATGAVSYNICMVSLFTVTARVTHVQLATISCATYAQHHALLFTIVGIEEAHGRERKFLSKMFPDFQQFYFTLQILRFPVIESRMWNKYTLKLKKKLTSKRM